MPVPVPRHTRLPAHPVYKRGNDVDNAKPSVFQQLTHTLPVSPAGPPPSFGTREEWINSLPSWRKLKPRRIWEDDNARIGEGRGEQTFSEGLTGAANASVIKGTHVQTCIPPLFTFIQNSSLAPVAPQTDMRQGCDEDADDEMSSDYSVMDQGQYENESQWSASSQVDSEVDLAGAPQYAVEDRPGWHRDDGVVFDEQPYEKGAFTPVFEEDEDPPQMIDGPDVASSPIGPATPFGEYVDRAVAAADPYPSLDGLHPATDIVRHASQYRFADDVPDVCQEEPKAAAPMLERAVIPFTTTSYKKLAEPLADWVASYVWKVCTTGMSLKPEFAVDEGAPWPYSDAPPAYLAGSIHSLLLSTLLQPSAILLALRYITRLPVYFRGVGLGSEHVKELRFRIELLGDTPEEIDKEAFEMRAPFRLVLLGCMLANKWLDDHTFSNKTWQTISNVPIESLNKLESLALDIFSHNLSTPPPDWSHWLTHLIDYHHSLSSPSHPQPISRPSTNPYSIIRKALEEIIQAPLAIDSSIPEPVFLGLQERRREIFGIEEYGSDGIDVLEIDLDEDGPLREEYLPKRRVSRNNSVRSIRSRDASDLKFRVGQADWENRGLGAVDVGKVLPPPAKWSPAADEPIFRERGRASGQYVAVQPPLATGHFPMPLPPVYQQEIRYQNWPASASCVPVGQHLAAGYVYDPASQPLPAYTPYSYIIPNQLHSHSNSFSCDHKNCQLRDHVHSHSQAVFGYGCGDIGMMANDVLLPRQYDAQWAAPVSYGCTASYRQPFAPLPNANSQSTWLRT